VIACRFCCTVRIPLHILSSGTYLLTIDMHTYIANNLYVLKARDAVTVQRAPRESMLLTPDSRC
jgi:hypothetical protein